MFCLLVLAACQDSEEKNDVEVEYEMDEGVVVLTDKNFDDYLKKNPTVLVEFYAPWYVRCSLGQISILKLHFLLEKSNHCA